MLARTPFKDIMFDKETIISWFESKNPDETYDYCDAGQCLFAQFAMDHGADPYDFYAYKGAITIASGWLFNPPGVWHKIARPGSGEVLVSTFGKALERAKKLLK